MRISEILKDLTQTGVSGSTEKASESAESFLDYLQAAQQSEDTTEEVTLTGAESTAAEIADTLPAALFLDINETQNDGSGVAAAVDSVTQQLDGIVEALQSETVSLDTLQDVISSLSDEAANLQSSVQELAENSTLKELSDELNVLAYVESVKWQRGDYI